MIITDDFSKKVSAAAHNVRLLVDQSEPCENTMKISSNDLILPCFQVTANHAKGANHKNLTDEELMKSIYDSVAGATPSTYQAWKPSSDGPKAVNIYSIISSVVQYISYQRTIHIYLMVHPSNWAQSVFSIIKSELIFDGG